MENGTGEVIVSTDETSNTDYAQKFQQKISNAQEKKKKTGALALTAGLVIVLTIICIGWLWFQKFGPRNESERKEVSKSEETLVAANKYAHYILDGEKNNSKNITKIAADDGRSFIERIMTEDSNEDDRQKFVKNSKKMMQRLEKSIKTNLKVERFPDKEVYLMFIQHDTLRLDSLNNFYNLSYSTTDFSSYMNNNSFNIKKIFSDTYQDLYEYGEREKKSRQEDADRSELSDRDILFGGFYNNNMEYANALERLYNIYLQNNCFNNNIVDEICATRVGSIDEVKGVLNNIDELSLKLRETIELMKKIVLNDSQWMANNIREARGENNDNN